MRKLAELTVIFWDVDTQVDFIDPAGKLYVPGAERIVPSLAALNRYARSRGILVISSACAHHEGEKEFEIYPPHCLAGTPGQQKIPETLLDRKLVLPPQPAEVPHDPRQYEQIILEKRELDVFKGNPNTEALLERLGVALEVVLYGVVTEICVALTARGLMDRGHSVQIVTDAVKALEQPKAKALFSEVVQRGGRLVQTFDVLSRRAA